MLIEFDHLFRKYNIRTTEVLHIGANAGQEAEAYIKHGVEKMVWVEAHHPTYTKLVKRVANLRGNHSCLHACVGDEDGKVVTFRVANNESQSSSILEFGTHTKEHPTVQFVDYIKMVTKRIDTLLMEAGIEFSDGAFLNIDLQGAEMLALLGMGDLLFKFQHLYLEVNTAELYKGCALVHNLDDYLKIRGYVGKEVKMTGSGWGDKYYQRI